MFRLHAASVTPLVVAAGVLTVALTLATAALVVDPAVSFVTVDSRLDLVVNTLATTVALIVAGLSWLRFRSGHGGGFALQATAFLVLALAGGLALAFPLVGIDSALGYGLSEPGQFPIYAGMALRLAAAILLFLAAIGQLRGWNPSTRLATVMAAGSLLGLVTLVSLLAATQQVLPPLFDPEHIRELESGTIRHPLPASSRAAQGVALLTAVLFGLAALLYLRRHLRDGQAASGYLGLGLVLAAFGQLHFTLFPAVHARLIGSEDLLRVGFSVALIVGLAAQQHADLRALRGANVALARLRDLDVRRARIEERGRLARELHDGLSQRLWRARLAFSRLADLPTLDGQARDLARETEAALVAALADARAALQATRGLGETTLGAELATELQEFELRTGIRTELHGSERFIALPSTVRAEVAGIAREALANIERHADATLVRVELDRDDGRLSMRIFDNGRGFDASRPPTGRFGLLGMQERAHLVGALLRIRSAPYAGTLVEVSVPLDPHPQP